MMFLMGSSIIGIWSRCDYYCQA